ncbi:MAG: hypothetical protein GEU94_12540 [Micromonosporaceae bacterium]|nr:hypothetical protein [Micromonosporaceae bacterium]
MAWVAVHPAAEQGFADRPPVPQPGVFAPAPDEGSAGGDDSVSARPGQAGRKPAAPESRKPSADPSRTGLPSVSPPVSPTSKPPTTRPPTGPPTSPPTSDDPGTVYRSAQSQGGRATFEYDKSGDVYVVSASPQQGWRVSAYRYDHDWVVVEFEVYDHISTVHAYLHQGRATIEVIEESY